MLPLNPDMAQRDFLLWYGVRIAGEDNIAFKGDDALDGDYIWMGRGAKAVLIYETADFSFSTSPVTSRSQSSHTTAPKRPISGQITGNRISISFSTPKPAHSPKNDNIPPSQSLGGVPHSHGQDVSAGSFVHIGVEEWVHTPPRNPHELEDMRMEEPDDGEPRDEN